VQEKLFQVLNKRGDAGLEKKGRTECQAEPEWWQLVFYFDFSSPIRNERVSISVWTTPLLASI
jgi:hypothetical protein